VRSQHDPLDDIQERKECRNGIVIVQRIQDVEPYLEANKRRRDSFQSDRKANRRLVAEVPCVIIEQWMKEGINVFDRNHAKAVQAKLNSNEFAYLRTSPGKIVVK
jgi:hypothetical protein